MSKFTHLHVHTQFSVLDGASSIKELFAKAKADGMEAVAITDHGNMFGVKSFLKAAKGSGVKPIIGCEVYVARGSRFDKNGKSDLSGNHLVLLAKNLVGYHNLVKLVSMGYIDGFYGKPRIDKEILFQHTEGLIVSTACIGGEIPRYIRMGQPEEAEKSALEFKQHFGDDFYFELQRHQTSDMSAAHDVFAKQEVANKGLIELSAKIGVKLIATNDVHFVNAEDAEAHDRLICLNTGADLDDVNRMHYTKQEWFKTQAEMSAIFADMPEVLDNTMEIAAKIEDYDINSKAIMPIFPIPAEFTDDDDYLRHLAYEGAKIRYPEMDDDTRARIDFELETVKRMGFPGYFLIVQDFIREARRMGVAVGPGRGSAAGSVVAYCLWITNIDPIKYDLLFERFLNPDRISMPDIDIDFDDDGRGMVLKYVEDKYGKDKVAHIVTFGTMAAKSAIKDVARVQKLPLAEADRLSKMVPDTPKITLKKAFAEVPDLGRECHSSNPLIVETLKYAQVLEGSVRNIGMHACGIIIGRDDLKNYVPLCISKDKETNEDCLVTQYDGSQVEDIGLLKMDFLGLKTLSIIKEALANIKLRHNIDIDIDAIPLDDEKTYDLYTRGDTMCTFQFESDGMRKWLRLLKPNKIEDLIAMNALYRPGPMEYIPDFVGRKHGQIPITYDIADQEDYLKETYGITVYQEQVMRQSQALGGFTKGQADSLRKAMGKKIISVMNELKSKFIEGGMAKGHDEKILNKIWGDWEAFAEYAFNKSHSTCYSVVAYQTAYLKAHYPAEYMAAVVSRNLSNMTEIGKTMEECKRMGLSLKGPDINESFHKFTVNAIGDLRFGMAAVKNVGSAAVENIIAERANGVFKDVFDFVERVNLTAVGKKNIENLAAAGAFDEMNIKRHQFTATNAKGEVFVDTLVRYGNMIQEDRMKNTNSLFGGANAIQVSKPEIPIGEEWHKTELLKKEKELIGIFLSAHPLDEYKFEMEKLVKNDLSELQDLVPLFGKDVSIAGMVTVARDAVSKNGKPWGMFTLEDYYDTYEFRLFGKDYESFMKYLNVGHFLLIKASVQERFSFNRESSGPKELEVKIKSITLLGNAKEDMVKSVSITVDLKEITRDFISDVKELLVKNAGKVEFKVHVTDSEETVSVDLFSRKFRIGITKEFTDFVDRNGLKYHIN